MNNKYVNFRSANSKLPKGRRENWAKFLHNKTPCKNSPKIRFYEWIFGLFSKKILSALFDVKRFEVGIHFFR
jgi:hypothetical protein